MLPPEMPNSLPAVGKVRRLKVLNFFKRLRTSCINIRNSLPFSSGSPRFLSPSGLRLRSIFPVPLLICLAIVVFTLMLVLHHSQPHFRFLTRPPNIYTDLQHSELYADAHHFDPPSLFHVKTCLHEFDQASRILNYETTTPKQFSQIAFAIQASSDTIHLLPRLLSRIYHPRNVYVIHIDAKVEKRLRDKFNNFIQNNPIYVANVHILSSEMLTYKGISTVLNSIALMTLALESHSNWDYYINLSASDYPLLAPDDIARLLARPQAPSGLLNFVWFFPRKEWIPYSFRIRHMFWDPAASGYQHPRARLFHVARQKDNPLERYRAYTFTKAEAWVILSRPFIQFIIRSSFAKRMLLNHMHTLSVSEHFISDILFNHPVWRATVVPDSFRQVVWYYRGRRSGQHPYTLDRGPTIYAFWEYLRDTSSIFARKFSKSNSPLLDRIDVEISGTAICNGSNWDCAKLNSTRAEFLQRIVTKFDDLTQKTLKQQNFKWPKTAYPPLQR